VEFETLVVARSPAGTWQNLDQAAELARDHLASGGLLAHPTTGVYGLGGVRDSPTEESLARLKDRDLGSGFVYLVCDIAAAQAEFAEDAWSCLADRLAKRFWPGPLTLVLDDEEMTGIAIRVEAHPVTRSVLQCLAGAMSSTSLNRIGESAAVTSEQARRVLQEVPPVGRPVLFLDAGSLGGPPPSTLVRVRGDTYTILRQGAIDASSIEAASR
jgi:L-threonylcarbamoyladenylate synthase